MSPKAYHVNYCAAMIMFYHRLTWHRRSLLPPVGRKRHESQIPKRNIGRHMETCRFTIALHCRFGAERVFNNLPAHKAKPPALPYRQADAGHAYRPRDRPAAWPSSRGSIMWRNSGKSSCTVFQTISKSTVKSFFISVEPWPTLLA